MDEIVCQQEIAAYPERVWELIVTRAGRLSWMGIDAEHSVLALGDDFRWSVPWASDRPIIFSGTVVELVPSTLVSMRWDLDLSGSTSLVEIELAEPGVSRASKTARTTVTVRHDGFVESDMGLVEHNGYNHYWREMLDSLAAKAESRSPRHHHDEIQSGPHFAGGHAVLGLYVRAVRLGSPVHVAGLRGGDWLQKVDGQPVHSIVQYDEWLCQRTYGDAAVFALARTEVDIKLFAPPGEAVVQLPRVSKQANQERR